MPITDKVRKILWTRSGNRCANCNAMLGTDREQPFKTTVVGQECHIISRRLNGPRHRELADPNSYDEESNLILLCANCHLIVDGSVRHYHEVAVLAIKASHEARVRQLLADRTSETPTDQDDQQIALPKITTGAELLDILDGALAMVPYFEDTDDLEELDFIAYTQEVLLDYIDVLSVHDEPGQRIGVLKNLKTLVLEITGHKFYLFGKRVKRKQLFDNGKTMIWDVALLSLAKDDSKNIVNLGGDVIKS